MMSMRTQFGNMTITDDNKTIADKELQKEINDKILDNKEVEFSVTDEKETKLLDK